jgi:predicted dinucleotide-binding enzyme
MNIGILGSGNVGQQLAIGLTRSGHKVKIGTRDTSKLNDWVKSVGGNVSVGGFEDAASFGELLIIATLWTGTKSAIELAGKNNFEHKIVIDVTNPLDFSQGVPPKLDSSPGNSAGEKIQKWLPNSKIVKAFNSVGSFIMINPKLEDGNPDLVIAGNDSDSKKVVAAIAEGFGWQNVIDMGDISQSYLLEAFAMLWIVYGFKHNHWTHAFKLLRK